MKEHGKQSLKCMEVDIYSCPTNRQYQLASYSAYFVMRSMNVEITLAESDSDEVLIVSS